MKSLKKIRLNLRPWLAAALLLGLAGLPRLAGATTLVSQGFLASGNPATGSIVSLQPNTTDYVDLSTVDNADNILGVVIAGDNSQISISSGQGNQIQVATSGVEEVLVSDINGDIVSGDPITASPISGVGMKATATAKVVGVAQGAFPNSTATKQTYTDKGGQKNSVTLGEIPVLINVAYFYKQPAKTLIPAVIQNLANALAGKQVNSLPIIISIGIFLVTLVVVVSIVYSLIRSSIISVGRNPMAQAAVYRNVIQLSVLVLGILAVAIVSIYMVLTKF